MSMSQIKANIARLLKMRMFAQGKELDRINAQLDKLYEFKYELLKGAENGK